MIGNQLNFETVDSTSSRFDFIGEGSPAININPPQLGMAYLDKSTGKLYHCTDNTWNNNYWNGEVGL